MSDSNISYFEITNEGVSVWWSWILVFWFTVLGWLLVQIVITGPIPELARSADPNLGFQIDKATENMIQQIDFKKVSYFGLIFFFGTLLGLISWSMNRSFKNSYLKSSGFLTGIGVIASFYGLINLFPLMNDAEANTTIIKAIGVSPTIYILFLLVFPASLIALYLGQKYIHQRTILSLHTASPTIRWNRGINAFLVTWLVLGTLSLAGHISGLSVVKANFQAENILLYMILSLALIPLQSATEEIVFRGYLNQWFTHLLKNKWIAFIISSALFASMHLSNPEALKGAEDGVLLLTMSGYFLFGFVACLLVWMDNGLESAIGFHAANNTFAAIFINYEGSVLPVPSLFMAKPNINLDMPIMVIALIIITLVLYKTRYKSVS
ncbi:CPBP family intramembrane metalloprotease [Hellea sp.]|jgi:membrane protease YdiL (CAAX protease family)|nr:CPBP family intramembrane metalloprotease [Hellea sp.]